MADDEWLTPRQISQLNFEQQQDYFRQRLEDLHEENSEDEPIVEEVLDDNVYNINPNDSDAEQLQVPEYNSEEDEEEEDGRYRSHNILRSATHGQLSRTQGLSIVETFKLIMSEEMCDIIIRETNRKAKQVYDQQNKNNSTKTKCTWKMVTQSEFDAYLGLLLLGGVTHSGYVHTKYLWKTTSHPLYRAAMSVRRFWAVSRFIRFVNGNTRQQRQEMDIAAAITDIFVDAK